MKYLWEIATVIATQFLVECCRVSYIEKIEPIQCWGKTRNDQTQMLS